MTAQRIEHILGPTSMLFLISTLLFAAPVDSACASANRAAASQHSRAAAAAFDRGDRAKAADLWILASRLNLECAKTYRRRLDHVRHALNALAALPAGPTVRCNDDPILRSARLIRTTQAELRSLPDTAPAIREARDEFDRRFAAIPDPAQAAATLLDSEDVSAPALELHRRAAPAHGACPDVRAALARNTLARLKSPSLPACDPASNDARTLLRDTLAAMEQAEPDTARATSEYAQLQQRLVSFDAEGEALTAIRARATSATLLDDSAAAWAELARSLPTCSVHLKAKHDAALAAVTAWQAPGTHRGTASERYTLAHSLLVDVLAAIEAERGEHASTLPEHASLIQTRDALKPPEVPKRVDPPPPQPPAKERWIHQHRPERNLLELGLFGGLSFLPSQTHQLVATDHVWRPYRKVNAALGLRFAWYPLSFLGLEAEGGVSPTRILENEEPGARATVFAARGHLVGQLPFWRITPFAMVGGGLLGTTGALGKDIDVALNVGGGIKFFVTRHFMLRVDVREVRTNLRGSTAGGTNAAEVLLGLSLTLNRRRVQKSTTAATQSQGHP